MPHENHRRRPRSRTEEDAIQRHNWRLTTPTPTTPTHPTHPTHPTMPTPTHPSLPTSPRPPTNPTHMRTATHPLRPPSSSTTLSPALAACWASLLSLPSSSTRVLSSASSPALSSSSSSSSSGASSTTGKSPYNARLTWPYLLADPSPSPRKHPRLHYHQAHGHAHKTSGEDDDDEPDGRLPSVNSLLNPMPRRKRKITRPLHLEVPALADAVSHCHDLDEGHLVFRVNGDAIISPRSIRNSLMETDVDMEGHVRTRRGSISMGWAADDDSDHPHVAPDTQVAIQAPNPKTSSKSSKISADKGPSRSSGAVMGPALPPDQPSSGSEDESTAFESNPSIPACDAALSQLTGAQLWVHRVLSTHHHTLHKLGMARETFPNTRLSLKQLESVIRPVVTLCNMMTPEQFGIRAPSPTMAMTMSEVHYWKLWESDTIDVGIFFMPPGGVIPLHNHPGMSVVTRVLYGAAHVTSYDLVPKSELAELPVEDVEAGNNDIKWGRISREGDFEAECTMWLDPRRFNLHHIRANDQIGCALLDIMIPPYDNADRDCHQYEILADRILSQTHQRVVKMLESVQPDNHNEPTGAMAQR